jgi:glyceraldehyde 3-phosphate dehydrogenase
MDLGVSAEAFFEHLYYPDEPLVSVDFMGDTHSAIVDGLSTKVIGKMTKVMAWYDNEWGYSYRILDLILHIHSKRSV